MHSPLSIPAHVSPLVRRAATQPPVHAADRLWDALSMLLVIAGTTLFVLARNGLASLASGAYRLPKGTASYVQRADYFSAQSTLGVGMIGLGVAVGIAASIRHWRRRRAGSATPPRSA